VASTILTIWGAFLAPLGKRAKASYFLARLLMMNPDEYFNLFRAKAIGELPYPPERAAKAIAAAELLEGGCLLYRLPKARSRRPRAGGMSRSELLALDPNHIRSVSRH
jgi:hypothetical protein